jgi:predicted Zn-dependent protease
MRVNKTFPLLLALFCLPCLASCRDFSSLSAGDIVSGAHSLVKVGTAVAKTFEDITPEQEYYIGRAVGAQVLTRYAPYNDPAANRYINTLGQTLARSSDRPQTFRGYHFLILDSNDINAFAAPGGLIFVTRGMIRCCPDEDALAAVLAHEVGHVQLLHGLRAIKNSRLTTALSTLGVEAAKQLGPSELAQVTSAFEDSIKDITSTLIDNGYSRAYEGEADRAAVAILTRVGYNPGGLIEMLNTMNKQLRPGGFDFAKTHPAPNDRIADLQKAGFAFGPVLPAPARLPRFQAAVGRL